MPKVSVVILNWNTANETAKSLQSLDRQTFRDFEVVLVDNGSTEEDYKNLKKIAYKSRSKIRVLRIEKNIGLSGGANLGVRNSKGDYILFMNNDATGNTDFIEKLLVPFSKYDGVGATVSKVFFDRPGIRGLVQYAGGELTFYGKAAHIGTGMKDVPEYNKEKETQWAFGVSLMVKKEVLKKLGEVFPAAFYTYFEDVDLSWRIRSSGYRIIYTPSSVVYHIGSKTMEVNSSISNQDRLSFRNKYLCFWRNLPQIEFFSVLPFMIVYDLLRIVKNILMMGRVSFATAYIFGLLDFISLQKKVSAPRKGSLENFRKF